MPLINFPSSPYTGQTYTFNGRTWEWNGYAWDVGVAISGGGGGGGADYLSDLNDVELLDPYVGQALVYNGAYWENEYVVNTVNGINGDVVALSDMPTVISGVNFDANLGTISNLNIIQGNNGSSSVLTIIGDLIVTGNITATTPGTTIEGDTIDTNLEDIDGGTYA